MTNPNEPDDDSNAQAQLLAAFRADRTRWPVLAVPLNGLVAGGPPQLYSGECDLMGWAIFSSIAAGFALIRDGLDTGGTLVAGIGISANLSDTQTLGPVGVRCRTGVWMGVGTGQLFGAVFVRPVGHHRSR